MTPPTYEQLAEMNRTQSRVVLSYMDNARRWAHTCVLMGLAVIALVIALWFVSHRRPVIVIPQGPPMSVEMRRPWSVYPNVIGGRKIWKV